MIRAEAATARGSFAGAAVAPFGAHPVGPTGESAFWGKPLLDQAGLPVEEIFRLADRAGGASAAVEPP